jgi:hypothetical protein
MERALVQVDAPDRQLRNVRAWKAQVDRAAEAASAIDWAPVAGTSIQSASLLGLARPPHVLFLFGRRDHRAWRDLCQEIVAALTAQQERAQALIAKIPARAPRRLVREYRRRLRAAEAWLGDARTAAEYGSRLIAAEGTEIPELLHSAIRRAGGVGEVADSKYYHQRGLP